MMIIISQKDNQENDAITIISIHIISLIIIVIVIVNLIVVIVIINSLIFILISLIAIVIMISLTAMTFVIFHSVIVITKIDQPSLIHNFHHNNVNHLYQWISGCNVGGANAGLSCVWKTVCHEAQPWTTLASSLRGTTVLLPRLWKGFQAEGAHAEAPEQPPSEGRGCRAGFLDGQPHGGSKRPKNGDGAGPHHDPRPRVTKITCNTLKTKSSKILTSVILYLYIYPIIL